MAFTDERDGYGRLCEFCVDLSKVPGLVLTGGHSEPIGQTALPGRKLPAASLLVGSAFAFILTPAATSLALVPNPESQNLQPSDLGNKASHLPALVFRSRSHSPVEVDTSGPSQALLIHLPGLATSFVGPRVE